MPGFRDEYTGVVGIPNLDGFPTLGCRQLFSLKGIVRAVATEAFDVEIVDIDKGVRHSPCHVLGMAEVRKTGHAGNRQPDDVEVFAGDMSLGIHVRHFELTMRVAGDDRPSSRGVLTGQRPIVATAGKLRADRVGVYVQ